MDPATTVFHYAQEIFEGMKAYRTAEGKIQLKPLISKHFAFRDFLSAYQYIDANRERTMKVVVDIQD